MAAPREVPIILGIFIALAVMMAHQVAVHRERASPRSDRPRVVPLATSARAPSPTDALLMVGIGGVGLAGIAGQVLARRARLLRARAPEGASVPGARQLTPEERGGLARRAGLVLAAWGSFAALSFGVLLRHPPDERLLFLVPCLLLVAPARVYVRHQAGEAMWVPWLLWLSALVLAVTREPRSTWGLLLVAGVCQVLALRQEHAARRAEG